MTYNSKRNWKYDEIVTENDMNRIEQGIADAHREMDAATAAPLVETIVQRDAAGRAQVMAPLAAADIARKDTVDAVQTHLDSIVTASPAATPLNLSHGTQVVSVPRTTPYNLLDIKGRTLVNLLGRDGNCEDPKVPSSSGAGLTYTSDTSRFKSGSTSIKVTKPNAPPGYYVPLGSSKELMPVQAGKSYLLMADVFNDNMNSIFAGAYGVAPNPPSGGVIVKSNSAIPTGVWSSVFAAYKVGVGTDGTVFMTIAFDGVKGSTANIDNVRLYEIPNSVFDSITDGKALSISYPYVDDMKSVVNPYVIKSGENLLSPLIENSQIRSNSIIAEPYKWMTSAGGNGDFSNFLFRVTPNTEYTLSASLNNAHHSIWKEDFAINIVPYTTNKTFTFNSGNNTNLQYTVKAVNTALDSSVTNPMLNLGSTALPFKPKADDYLFFPSVQLASNVDGTVYDTLYKRGGRYWKQSRFKVMDLDGSLSWLFDISYSGFKIVKFISTGGMTSSNGGIASHNTVKYDGKLLQTSIYGTGLGVHGAPDRSYIDAAVNNIVYISIANVDSGWGDSYTPTQAEIQAYFNGWKMSANNTVGATPTLYTGSGVKYWCNALITGATQIGYYTSGNDIDFVVRTPINNVVALTRYKLQYQLATPTVEEIAVEGDITLREGLNQFEVGNGMIVRERANPQLSAWDLVTWWINSSFPGYEQTRLKNRAARIQTVYKNGKADPTWFIDLLDSWGTQRVYTRIYDSTAVYTVTYIAEHYSLTSNVLNIQSEYASNLKTVVDTLATNQADVATRVGALEITRAQKEASQWIYPTLINGATAYEPLVIGVSYAPPRYRKDSAGLVYCDGLAKLAATDGHAIYILPKGYRPLQRITFASVANRGSAEVISRATINPDGRFVVIGPASEWHACYFPPFLAEQ